jgi:hypothetical protein
MMLHLRGTLYHNVNSLTLPADKQIGGKQTKDIMECTDYFPQTKGKGQVAERGDSSKGTNQEPLHAHSTPATGKIHSWDSQFMKPSAFQFARDAICIMINCSGEKEVYHAAQRDYARTTCHIIGRSGHRNMWEKPANSSASRRLSGRVIPEFAESPLASNGSLTCISHSCIEKSDRS